MSDRFRPPSIATRRRLAFARVSGMADALAETMRDQAQQETPVTEVPVSFVELWHEQFNEMIRALRNRGDLQQIPFTAQVQAAKLREGETRDYVFIQNQDGANQLIVGFGNPPGIAGTVPVNGLIIPPNLGFYEPLVVPQNDIWVIASAANTPGLLLIATV